MGGRVSAGKRFSANGRLLSNGLVTSDRNEVIALIPACAVPVPTSPASCGLRPVADAAAADAAAAAHAAEAPSVILLVSNVTEPLRAQAAPQVILAPVSSEMLVSARMSPANDVVVPRNAELPTLQNTLPPEAPLINRMREALAVVSVLLMLKIKTELGLPRPL